MNNNNILDQLSAAMFAAWDLHLYLDTHPFDTEAIEMFKQYTQKADKLRTEYEEMCGPLSSGTGYGERWTKDPWPWHICAGDC